MTRARLDALLALADAATPGPWVFVCRDGVSFVEASGERILAARRRLRPCDGCRPGPHRARGGGGAGGACVGTRPRTAGVRMRRGGRERRGVPLRSRARGPRRCGGGEVSERGTWNRTARRSGGPRRAIIGAGPAAGVVHDCPHCSSPTQGSWTRSGMRSALCVSCQDAAGGDCVVDTPGEVPK